MNTYGTKMSRPPKMKTDKKKKKPKAKPKKKTGY
jgi:hypothetical protein